MPLRRKGALSTELIKLGIPTAWVGCILKDVEHWVDCSGEEWTVNRLKNLRAAYLKFLGRETYELPWIAHRICEGNPVPKGIWGKLWTRESSWVPRVLKVLHLYSVFRFRKVTEQQRKKFLESVWALPILRFDHKLMRNMAQYAGNFAFTARPYRRSLIASVRSLPPRHRKKFPKDFVRGVHYMTMNNLWYTDLTLSWGGYERWISRYYGHGTDHVPGSDRVGNLGITQERGGKLRVFAFPNLLFQVMMNPMKATLFRILKKIPEDCTFDQERGVTWVREELRSGRCAWSVDLSDATNHFPLQLQKLVFLNIALDPQWETHWELFEMVATGAYGANPLGRNYVRWTKGQPLGAGPSFALFALSHHAVLHHCKVVNKVTDDCYRILGDDVVITNEAVYNTYRSVLSQLACPVSPTKSMTSREVAEFGGHVVTRDLVIGSTKFLDGITVGNVCTQSWLYRDHPPLPNKQWLAWYRLWYSTFGRNSLGIPKDRRDSLVAAFYLYQRAKQEEKGFLKERFTFQQLYWAILQDSPAENPAEVSPDQGDVPRVDDGPFGLSPLHVSAMPSAPVLSGYASMQDLRDLFGTNQQGLLRAYRNAVSEILTVDERQRYGLV